MGKPTLTQQAQAAAIGLLLENGLEQESDMAQATTTPCDRCGGDGYVETEICLRCRGDGIGYPVETPCDGCETPKGAITDGYCANCWREAEGWQREAEARAAMMEESAPDWSKVDLPYADDIAPAPELPF